jgi:protein PsiE
MSEDRPAIDTADKAKPAERNAFQFIERAFLIIVAVMTIVAASLEMWRIVEARNVHLADILLMFLYTEVIGMVAVFYRRGDSPLIYPIFIAITALSRLIVLQGKDMDPANILFEAGSILLLAIAVIILGYGRKN